MEDDKADNKNSSIVSGNPEARLLFLVFGLYKALVNFHQEPAVADHGEACVHVAATMLRADHKGHVERLDGRGGLN